jgi:molybdopterin-containing oxidoreductase family iron-sulfur binding subunit
MIRQGGKLVKTTWDEALKVFTQKLGEVGPGASNAVFINRHESGSFPAVLNGWLAARGIPAALSIDPDADYAAIAAFRQSLGVSWPRFDFSAASLIVSFGADFLDGWGASVPQQLDFAEARAKKTGAPRLIYVGARRSLTGLNADQWIDAKPGSELAIVHMLGGSGAVSPEQASQQSGVPVATLVALKKEYDAAKPAMVLASGATPHGMELCLAAYNLNSFGGGIGTTVTSTGAPSGFEGMDSPSQLRALAQRMQAGQVPLLMIRNVNPVYFMPKSSGFAAAMAKAGFKVSFSPIKDDTSEMCDLILPDNHSLESWGDAQAVAGTLSLQQPVMDPVFDTRATADVLISVSPAANTAPAAKDYRTLFISRFAGGASGLAASLPKGIAAGTTTPPVPRTIPAPAAAEAARPGEYALIVYSHPVIGMGDGANKPWLQELPDPVTKIAWQTVAEIHPATARKLGVENGDHVTVETSSGKLSLPVYVYIGVHPSAVAIAAGRGHAESAGRYAKAGSNALDLVSYMEDRSGAMIHTAMGAKISKDGAFSRLVTTEGSARQHGRGIGQAVAVADLGKGQTAEAHESVAPGEHIPEGQEPEFPGDASHEFLPGLRSPTANDAQGDLGGPELKSKEKGMYDPGHWSGMAKRRWAMTVDLARCTGCSACVTACYAENNIPTVGADWQGAKFLPDRTGFGANITRSREMSWIRLERYFEGGEDGSANFDARFVPMMCQHCGNAPCEPVCPVYATYHAPDGLNVQVYNRCVGTRYCSNNCPYKVRYFNWFGYGEPARAQYAFPEPLNWQLNPDVTVRGKGVMEKCSFCVQRIREAENRASLEHRGVEPDEFTTACAEACPSRAITFGDAADERWTVAKLVNDERAYHVFEELNTYTAVVYLKKISHPGGAA